MLSNSLNLPRPFVDAATSDHTYKEGRYGVTDVLGGTCEAVLKRRHHGEQEEDVADRVWAIFGSAVHEILRRSEAEETQLQENWLSVAAPVEGYELSGIFDLYDDATGTVTDYKTCSVWKAQVGDFEDWRKQTLLYCCMLRSHGFDAHKGQVVAIMRDHNMRKARTESGYPKHPVQVVEWDFTEQDFIDAWAEVKAWFEEVAEQERVPDEFLKPCGPEQRWSKPTVYAVHKDGNKKATKLFDDEDEAALHAYVLGEKTGKPHHVEVRPGEDTKCEWYCPVSEFCPKKTNHDS